MLAPLPEPLAGPHTVASCIVTLWPYVENTRTADETDAELAAATLVSIHRGLLDYAAELPPYTDALDHCREVLADLAAPTSLTGDDRDLLEAHYFRLRDETEAADGDWVPLHGDAHLGNLLIGPHGPLWIDFEDACRGPREYDIACLSREVWPCFVDADQALIARFAGLQSVCVAI